MFVFCLFYYTYLFIYFYTVFNAVTWTMLLMLYHNTSPKRWSRATKSRHHNRILLFLLSLIQNKNQTTWLRKVAGVFKGTKNKEKKKKSQFKWKTIQKNKGCQKYWQHRIMCLELLNPDIQINQSPSRTLAPPPSSPDSQPTQRWFPTKH